MFTESMFATRDGEQRLGSLSVWPAAAAASFAWLMALLRLCVGEARREILDLDMTLAMGALVLVPAIIVVVCLNARRAGRARFAGAAVRGDRHHLRLVSSTPSSKPRVHAAVTARQAGTNTAAADFR